MNGPPARNIWQEAKNAEGRVYYYNTQTKATQWNKPEALMTSPVEIALSRQPWKQYYNQDTPPRPYWYNTETKQSSWKEPEEYRKALDSANQPPQRPPPNSQTYVAGGGPTFGQIPPFKDRNEFNLPDRPDRQYGHSGADSLRNPVSFVSQSEPDYATLEDAETAFMKLLKRSGVQPDWTWQQAMRATIKDPQYRAIKDPKDRRAAFEKYVVDVRLQEKDKERERLAKLRADFFSMLRSQSEIKHYTRWKTARPIIEGETVFRSAQSDEERRQFFEEYIIDLKNAHNEEEMSNRKAALDDLIGLLRSLDMEPYTRWTDAQDLIHSNERFKSDDKYKSLTNLDVLRAFENHIKALERSFNDKRQKQKSLKVRRERKNRDRFQELLKELQSQGMIKAGTKWNDIHGSIENDERYLALLGQPGSTPLDLFWDVVEEEERKLRATRNDVLDVLDDKRIEMTPQMTLDEFQSIIHSDRRTATVDVDSLALIFERLHDKMVRRSEDDKHHAERSQRRAIDALRYRIKHLDPPVLVDSTWEQVRPRLEKLDEFHALESDDLRRSAFDKIIRRLRDKEEDLERERSRRDNRARDRDRDRDRDRVRDRDRDRDYRNGHADPRRRHRTRTPEPDAYEADRKKAQADRERQYRKTASSNASSPPYYRRDVRDERDHYDRDRERDRGSRHGQSHYERERREREMERERSYISRADPRDRASELDYGDSRTGSSSARRRRDSDDRSANSLRDAKKQRTTRDGATMGGRSREPTFSPRQGSRTPAAQSEPREDPGLRSGSEEGEIEED